MRKILNKVFASTIASILAVSAMPLSNVCADDEVDLKQLASSLGADKDHFSFVNFSLKDYSQDIADKYASRLTSLELTTSRSEWAQYYSMSGLCYGISALEVLTHNNVITPSQIQSGAGSLSEVRLDSNVKDALYYYQSSQYFQSAMFKDRPKEDG